MRLRVLHHPPIVSRQRTKLHFRFDILTLRLADDLRRRQRALGDDVESREFRPLRFLFSSLRRAESFPSIIASPPIEPHRVRASPTPPRASSRASNAPCRSRRSRLRDPTRASRLALVVAPLPVSRVDDRARLLKIPRARRDAATRETRVARASTSREDVDFSVPWVAPTRFREPTPRALGDVDRETRARRRFSDCLLYTSPSPRD